MENRNGPASIGTIELSNIGEQFFAEMSPGDINLANRIGFCSIEVWPNEGLIPHFHIIPKDPKVAKKWQCCICLYEPMYFNHGLKQGTLTDKQIRILDSWLREDYNARGIKGSRWSVLCMFWDAQGNPQINVPPKGDNNIEQPKYTKMVKYR